MIRTALALLIVALFVGGCEPPPPLRVPVLRFIEETTPALFDAEAFLSEEAVVSWGFLDEPPGQWVLRDVASIRADGVGWWIEPKTRRVVLGRQLEDDETFEAADIDMIAVTAESRMLGGADIHWAAEGEALSPDRHMQIRFSGRTRHTFLFRVKEHPLWQGRISRLQITLWTHPRTQVGLTSIRALRESVDGGAVERALAHPWRVELDGDQRVALASVPEHPLTRTLDVPAGASLELAYGVRVIGNANALGPVGFRVLATRLEEATGPPGAPQLIAERLWSGESRWQSMEVDLAPFAGSRVRLQLEVTSDEPIDPRHGLPLWAHPQVLAPVTARADELPPNVVLIVVDTLRADHLSLYGYPRPSSPHLTAWAKRRATVFESVVSSAGWTLPSHVSIFSGLDAHRHGVNWPTRAPDELTFLAERLHQRGYTTEAITGGGYLEQSYGLEQGFERYTAWRREHGSHEAEPPHNLTAALAALKRLEDRPFFLFLHTYAVHAPYAPWQPYFSQMSDLDPLQELVAIRPSPTDHDGRAEVFLRGEHGEEPLEGEMYHLPTDQYDSGIARFDGLLEPLLKALDERNLARRTIVALTSDHGEMLGERGLWEHGQVYDPVLRVPLLIAAPDGLGAGRRVSRQVRSVDLVPTLLDLIGLEPPKDVDGVSLTSLMAGDETSSVPVAAWSYGRKIDSGLTLRIRDRYKLFLYDDLLSEWPSEVHAFAVDKDPTVEHLIDMPPELEPYAKLARERLLDQLPGLHLHFANQEAESLHLEIESGAAVPERIKVPNLPCDCLEWKPPTALEAEVPPGESFTVILTDVRDARLLLTLKRKDQTRQRLTLDLVDLDRPLALSIQEGRWQVAAGPPPETGVGVAWRHAGLTVANDPTADPEVRQSLRALGYVE